MSTLSHDLLNAALAGLEARKEKIDGQIKEVRVALGQRSSTAPAPASATAPKTTHKKRVLSAAARGRIAAAQKKRWAAKRAAEAKS